VKAFENAYGGTPSWELGRPQPAVVRLAEAGRIVGRVLDVGCGTGENALYLAARGHAVVGIDFAPAAIARARAKAAARGLCATFLVQDALHLGAETLRRREPGEDAALGGAFDTLLDVGLFHTLQPADRAAYAAGLRAVIDPGGRCFLLCWSNRNPFGYGPQRIGRRDLRLAFRRGWRVERLGDEALETRLPPGRVHAWLAHLTPR
jgi:SAM-dependent methyltransferase